jgi:signal transduction histidine kinase
MEVATHRLITGNLTSEAARLAAVNATRLVSDALSATLSGLAQLTAEAMGVQIAAVTLVDSDRVRMVARHQLMLSQTRLTGSPCSQVVADRAPVFISDLGADPRFAGGQLTAAGVGARSYAGVPLIDPDGHAVGTLCVLGLEAEVFGPERRALLGMFGEQANALFALSRSASRSAAEADTMGRLGDEFLTLMNHEVRTPITVITGYLELLDEIEAVPQQYRQKMTTTVRRNTERLVRLVDHLLLAARGGDGLAASLIVAPNDLTELVSELVAAAQSRADLGGTEIEMRPAPVVTVRLDRGLIRTAVDNLISNALEFTPPGGRITVTVANEPAFTSVTVSDTGIGIPLAEQGLVLDRFYRGEQARQMESPGIGLGLSVTAAIADAHGGGVRLDSKPGEGTSAHLILPTEHYQQ